MNSNDILNLITKFDWSKLNNIFGCAHSSIIGFLSYEWINISKENTVLDGAPSPLVGTSRKGQRNADLLLCNNKKPIIPVEVETQVSKYQSKIETIGQYVKNFPHIEFGFMVLTNLTTGTKKYQHNWDELKKYSKDHNLPIVLISIIKKKIGFTNIDDWSTLLKRNDYSAWEITEIDYYIYDKNKTILENKIWTKTI